MAYPVGQQPARTADKDPKTFGMRAKLHEPGAQTRNGGLMAGTGGSRLPYGPGSALFKYWMSKAPQVAAQVHKWTWLHRQILKALVKAGEPNAEHIAKGLTTNLLQAMGYHNRGGEWVRV